MDVVEHTPEHLNVADLLGTPAEKRRLILLGDVLHNCLRFCHLEVSIEKVRNAGEVKSEVHLIVNPVVVSFSVLFQIVVDSAVSQYMLDLVPLSSEVPVTKSGLGLVCVLRPFQNFQSSLVVGVNTQVTGYLHRFCDDLLCAESFNID